jgi:hypothetical protein
MAGPLHPIENTIIPAIAIITMLPVPGFITSLPSNGLKNIAFFKEFSF